MTGAWIYAKSWMYLPMPWSGREEGWDVSKLRKKQEYKELRPVGTYDVAALESWLEERAREGYRLIRFKGL